jgi:glycosidase
MALASVLILPRIPQVYYGTEILMENSAKPGDHGLIRTDFPGGWEGDSVDAFSGEGLRDDQREMQDFSKALLQFRKSSKAIHSGKTTHFAPKDGIYVLFRSMNEETVVMIINKNQEPITLDLDRFNEMNLQGETLINVVTGGDVSWNDKLELNSRGVLILATKK